MEIITLNKMNILLKNYKLLSVSTLLILFVLAACNKKEKHEESESGEWKELDAFHLTMAEAFHPLKDSGNVEPATRLMGQLADEADILAKAPFPEKVNNDEVKGKVTKLQKDVRDLANQIKDGTEDDVVGTELYKIHDLFHEIQEAWSGGHHKEEGEHH